MDWYWTGLCELVGGSEYEVMSAGQRYGGRSEVVGKGGGNG